MDFPCRDCVYFDQQHKLVRGAPTPVWFGHCAKRSVYPHKELEGQVFPVGVKRSKHGELASMKIVRPDEVQHGCSDGVRK